MAPRSSAEKQKQFKVEKEKSSCRGWSAHEKIIQRNAGIMFRMFEYKHYHTYGCMRTMQRNKLSQ
eukprot:3701974-Karenia_brevis.AAC.1